ncbi:MAG: response regulator [Fibrobacteres bacterium]|nr:response regulator [Fibrobacterota bacterium]
MFNPADYSECPVTGERIIAAGTVDSSEYGGTKGYSARFTVIGGYVVHASVYGYSNIADTNYYISFLQGIIDKYFPDDKPFALIEDYRWHEGASINAKAAYIRFVRSTKGLKQYIFYNIPPFFKVLIKLARRLYPFNHFTVEMYNDYESAVRSTYPTQKQAKTNQGSYKQLFAGSEWQNITLTHEYSASFNIVDENVFISAPFGESGNEGIPLFVKVRREFLEKNGLWDKMHVEIKDYALVRSRPGRISRSQFAQAMVEERNRGMLKGVVCINMSPFIEWILKIGVKIYGEGIPFVFASSLSDAIDKAHKILLKSGVETKAVKNVSDVPLFERSSWAIKNDHFSFNCAVSGTDVVVLRAMGRPKESDLTSALAIMQECIKNVVDLFECHYRILDWSRLDMPRLSFVKRYSDEIRKINATFPSACTVIVGVSSSLAAIVKFYAAFSNSRIVIASNEKEAFEIISHCRENSSGVQLLPLETREEWNHITPSFSIEQAIYGQDILIQRIRGKASEYDLPGIERTNFIAMAEIEDRIQIPHFRICDLSDMVTPSMSVRSRYLSILRKLNSRFNARLVILSGMNPLLSFMFKLNRRLFGTNITTAANIAEAFAMVDLYRRNDVEYLQNSSSNRLYGNVVRSNPAWEFKTATYMIRVVLLGRDIVYVHEIGTLSHYEVESAVACRRNAVDAIRRDTQVYYCVENVKERTNDSLSVNRRYLSETAVSLKDSGIVFTVTFGANPVMSVILKALSHISIAPIYRVKDVYTALKFVDNNRAKTSFPHKMELPVSRHEDVQNLLSFIASINWESAGVENRGFQVSADHPLNPVYEAIALIKQDFDTVVADKDRAEKKIAEESRLNGMRADIWKIASGSLVEPKDLAISFVHLLRTPLDACRCTYMHLDKDADDGGAFVCLAEDRRDFMPQILGSSIPAKFLLPMLHEEAVLLNADSIEMQMKAAGIADLLPQFAVYQQSLNVAAALLLPYTEEESVKGYFTIEYSPERVGFCPQQEVAVIINRELRVLLSTVAARKRAEKAVQSAYNELEERVADRTVELSKTNTQLEEARRGAVAANEAKSRFLSNMSHEIRTPLNAIIGFSLAIVDSIKPEKNREYGEMINSESMRLLELINQFLDISKIEAGKMNTELIHFSLRSLISELQKSFGLIAINKGLQFTVDIDSTIPERMQGDEIKLRQVLVNLIGNAVKFTESGSVCVVIRRLRSEGGVLAVRFEVSDTGPGIPPEKIESIFLPFEQSDTQISKKYGGTGLGTSIANHLVKLLGGRIGVLSDHGRVGTTFWFELPFVSSFETSPHREGVKHYQNTEESELPKKDQLAGRRILLAEDYRPNQEIALLMLKSAGADIDLRENGKAAVEAVQNSHYDAVLMDVQMPEMDGLEATSTIRKIKSGDSLPIIGMTAYAFDEERARCFQAGMDDVITKPIDWEKAISAISAIISGHSNVKSETHEVKSYDNSDSPSHFDTAAYVKRMRGNKQMAVEIVKGFLEILPGDLEKFRTALAQGEVSTAERLAHSIKGAALNLCASQLAVAALEVERAMKNGKTAGIGLVMNMEHEADTFIESARAFIKGESA